MTRADRVRAMTDEEMANAVLQHDDGRLSQLFCKDPNCGGDDCTVEENECLKCIIQWIREE